MLPNPLIPGFSPDPSITQADGAYYLVTATFEYLPGIPVYRSTDRRRRPISWDQRRRPRGRLACHSDSPSSSSGPSITQDRVNPAAFAPTGQNHVRIQSQLSQSADVTIGSALRNRPVPQWVAYVNIPK